VQDVTPFFSNFSLLVGYIILFFLSFLYVAKKAAYKYYGAYVVGTSIVIISGVVFSLLTNFICENQIISIPSLYKTGVTRYFRYAVFAILFLALSGYAFNALIANDVHIGRRDKEKVEVEKLKLKYDLLQMQMAPHFLYNSLVNLNHTIRTGDAEKAIYYNNSIARLLRLHLENVAKEKIDLDTEISWLKAYMDVEMYRHPGAFSYIVNTNSTDLHEFFIPPMLLQPFIENSIKYGFSEYNNELTGTLIIDLNEEGPNTYVIRISEYSSEKNINELMPDSSIAALPKKTSVALDNIKQRIEVLNKISDFNITLDLNAGRHGFHIKLTITQKS
jgi:LytS/YehU family sensor histidine kinase